MHREYQTIELYCFPLREPGVYGQSFDAFMYPTGAKMVCPGSLQYSTDALLQLEAVADGTGSPEPLIRGAHSVAAEECLCSISLAHLGLMLYHDSCC